MKAFLLKVLMWVLYALEIPPKAVYRFFHRHLINVCDAYVRIRPDERNDISRRYW